MKQSISSWLSVGISLTALLVVILAVVSPAGAIWNRVPLAGSPTVVSYQGYVAVSGTAFHGVGYFKFAVVDATVSASYWSNDGSSSVGSEPTNPVQLPVVQGQFNVLLGDTSLTNMTQAMTASVFSGTDRYLRVWFSSDNVTFSLLAPDVRFAAAPFALQAEYANTAGDANTVDGQHAAGIMPSGSYILGQYNDANLLAAGFTQVGASKESLYENTWAWASLPASPVTGRFGHTATWTGKEMIIWGGYNGSYLADGASYNPSTGVWTALPASPLAARGNHTAIWTGTELIVWGGSGGGAFNDGARYNPSTYSWTTIAAAPIAPRGSHTAVWTGGLMIIWGGSSVAAFNDGASYNPATNTWATLPATGLAARNGHSCVWTGSEMIVWGGASTVVYADGARYNPATGVWSAVAASPLGVRYTAHTVWTGSEMIVWGGNGGGPGPTYWNDGAHYNPTSNTWTSLPAAPLGGRYGAAFVWTSFGEMILWGGWGGSPRSDGARYNLAANTWTSLPGSPLAARYMSMAVWTGTEMIIWGGGNGYGTFYNDGARYYTTLKPLYLFLKP